MDVYEYVEAAQRSPPTSNHDIDEAESHGVSGHVDETIHASVLLVVLTVERIEDPLHGSSPAPKVGHQVTRGSYDSRPAHRYAWTTSSS